MLLNTPVLVATKKGLSINIGNYETTFLCNFQIDRYFNDYERLKVLLRGQFKGSSRSQNGSSDGISKT